VGDLRGNGVGNREGRSEKGLLPANVPADFADNIFGTPGSFLNQTVDEEGGNAHDQGQGTHDDELDAH
jgi:hypothetical protein